MSSGILGILWPFDVMVQIKTQDLGYNISLNVNMKMSLLFIIPNCIFRCIYPTFLCMLDVKNKREKNPLISIVLESSLIYA